VAAFFARTDAATTASKANWCLSPCQTWRQWSFNHLSGPIEHEQNNVEKNADVSFGEKNYLYVSILNMNWRNECGLNVSKQLKSKCDIH
jgi:hypothetical protein